VIGCGCVGVGDDLVRVWSKFMQGLGSQPKSEQQNFKFNLSFSFETVHTVHKTPFSFVLTRSLPSLLPAPTNFFIHPGAEQQPAARCKWIPSTFLTKKTSPLGSESRAAIVVPSRM